MHRNHKELVVFERTVCINNTGFPFPDGFDLRPGKLNTCREFLKQKIFMTGFLIFDVYCFLHRLFLFRINTTLM